MAKIPVGFLCASMTGCVERRELSRDRGPVSTGTSIYWRQLAENGALSAIRLMAAGAAVPAPGSGAPAGPRAPAAIRAAKRCMWGRC